MIESRRLTREEINVLLEEAPETETRNLKRILNEFKTDASTFFDRFGLEHFGLLSEGRPIYMGVLTKNISKKYTVWTIVNSNVKDQFSLFKYSKRKVKDLAKKYGEIYATMEKINIKNIEWTKRIDFKQISEDDKTITLCLKGD